MLPGEKITCPPFPSLLQVQPQIGPVLRLSRVPMQPAKQSEKISAGAQGVGVGVGAGDGVGGFGCPAEFVNGKRPPPGPLAALRGRVLKAVAVGLFGTQRRPLWLGLYPGGHFFFMSIRYPDDFRNSIILKIRNLVKPGRKPCTILVMEYILERPRPQRSRWTIWIILALAFMFAFSASRLSTVGNSEVKVVPCARCINCACPRIAGTAQCLCPR